MPETTTDLAPTDSMGATSRVHVHKNESTKATQVKQSRQTTEPVVPQIIWNTDSIELNGKIHKLPITKDYMLKEYSDVFKGIGTLQGGPYHIRQGSHSSWKTWKNDNSFPVHGKVLEFYNFIQNPGKWE